MWLYHSTLTENLPGITRDGLRAPLWVSPIMREAARWGERRSSYWSERGKLEHRPFSVLRFWIDDPTELSRDPNLWADIDESAVLERPVPPQEIELLQGDPWGREPSWVPLRAARGMSEPVEWDEDYGSIPTYARGFERARVPVRQIASPFINPISQERIDELARLEDAGYTLPPIIVNGPHEVEEVDYPEEKYPFLDGHYPEVGEEVWYVHDGHHRVALALERGDRYIDALVMG